MPSLKGKMIAFRNERSTAEKFGPMMLLMGALPAPSWVGAVKAFGLTQQIACRLVHVPLNAVGCPGTSIARRPALMPVCGTYTFSRIPPRRQFANTRASLTPAIPEAGTISTEIFDCQARLIDYFATPL